MSSQQYQAAHRFGRHAYIVAALSFTVLSLVCLIVVSVSGLGVTCGNLDGLSFAVIDSSDVVVKSGGHVFYGLPDANDHSKHKDFFAFYLWNYCSGTKSSGRYIVDYCSGPRHSLYDLFGPWNLWGANVHKAGTHFYWLERGPKLLYIPYLVTICITILQIVTSIPATMNDKVSQTTVILAFFALLSFLTTAVAAQVTYSQLIRRADDEDIAISALRVGDLAYVANWVGVFCTLLALATWHRIAAGNKIQRAPTIDTGVRTPAKASGTSNSVYAWPLLSSPVRKRAIVAL